MKLIGKFFLVLSFFIVISCTNNDDKEIQIANTQLAINNTNISGKWYLKGSSVNGGTFSNYLHHCQTSKDYQEFHLNGELDFTQYTSSCMISDTQTSYWSLSNGTSLKVTSLPGAEIPYTYFYEVVSLTAEELILKINYNSPDGQVVVVELSHYTRN